MAQTDVSLSRPFGPVLVVHTLHVAYFVAKTCMHNKNLDCCKKDEEIFK